MAKKMNVRLLRKIRKHILENPKRLDMGVFLFREKTHPHYYKYPECGTVGCLAGWACVLSKEADVPIAQLEDRAKKLLGLTPRQAGKLFYTIPSFKAQSQSLANAVARQIDTFIATKGRTASASD